MDAAFEIVLWSPAHAALVAGDILLGAEGGGVRVCPDSWLGPWSPSDVREQLRPLLDLPVERILVAARRAGARRRPRRARRGTQPGLTASPDSAER